MEVKTSAHGTKKFEPYSTIGASGHFNNTRIKPIGDSHSRKARTKAKCQAEVEIKSEITAQVHSAGCQAEVARPICRAGSIWALSFVPSANPNPR